MKFHQYAVVHGASFNTTPNHDEELNDFAAIRTGASQDDCLKIARHYKKPEGSGLICLVYRDSASGPWRRIYDFDETEQNWIQQNPTTPPWNVE